MHTHPPSQVQAQVDRVVSYLSGLSYLACASVTLVMYTENKRFGCVGKVTQNVGKVRLMHLKYAK